MSKMIDITMEITEDIVVWPGSDPVKITQSDSIENGAVANDSSILMGMHTGTHVDAPLHFIRDGKSTAAVALNKFFGKAKVFCFDTDQNIGRAQLQRLDIREGDMILLNIAKNNLLLSDHVFREDYISLDADGAEYLVEKKIRAVGINYFSIEAYRALPGNPVHTCLLKNEVAILEALKLEGVEQGEYIFIGLPLKFKNGNGSPVRAVLIEDEKGKRI